MGLLFEYSGGNNFKPLKNLLIEEVEKPFFGWGKEPGTEDVDINTLPVTLDDLFSNDTAYLGNQDDPLMKQWKASARLLAARKIPGFGGPELKKSQVPGDFIYEIDVTY